MNKFKYFIKTWCALIPKSLVILRGFIFLLKQTIIKNKMAHNYLGSPFLLGKASVDKPDFT